MKESLGDAKGSFDEDVDDAGGDGGEAKVLGREQPSQSLHFRQFYKFV